jgi:glycosyltransferase domain-containing protein
MHNEDLINFLKKGFLEFRDKNLDFYDFSDLTIVIPTYNRLVYLTRQIIYLSNYSVQVIIADGSEERIDKKLINQLKFYKEFEYIHSADLSYVERIKFASKKVQTRYAMCLAEDDYLVFSGVKKAINILKNDNSLAACFGQIGGLNYNKSKKKTFFIEYGSSLKNYSIRYTNPLDRILFAFDSYRSFSPYALFKENNFREIWSNIENSSCLEVTEYEHAINTLLIGQFKTIDELFWIRSQELESLDSKLDGSRKNNFKIWYEEKIFKDEVKKFKQRVSKNIANYLECSFKDSLKILDDLIVKILNKKNHIGLDNKNNFKHIISLVKDLIISNSLMRNFYNNTMKHSQYGIRFRMLARYFGNKNISSYLLEKNNTELLKILKISDFFNKIL